jgi:hypothetical protein
MRKINPLFIVPLALIIVLGPFVYACWGMPLSTSMQDWANFGTYFAGMLTPFAGMVIFWQLKQQEQEKARQRLYETVGAYILDLDQLIDWFDHNFNTSPLIANFIKRPVPDPSYKIFTMDASIILLDSATHLPLMQIQDRINELKQLGSDPLSNKHLRTKISPYIVLEWKFIEHGLFRMNRSEI